MRRSSATHVAITLLGGALGIGTLVGCVVRLDDEFLPDGATNDLDAGGDAAAVAPDAQAEVAAGCALFRGLPGISSLAGDSHSLTSSDGGALWVVDQAYAADGREVSPAAILVDGGAGTDCAGWPAAFVGAATTQSPLEDGGAIVPFDLVSTTAGPALYYEVLASDPSAPLGLRALGYGIAMGDATGRFALTSDLLWTPDRPAFGGSALRVGDTVYVWGCKPTDAFDASCYVARVPAASVTAASAYSYWAGDTWSANADDASPVTSAGLVVSVRPDPTRAGRLLMTYVPPLGDTLVVRSALAPQGPWSAPVTLASCDLGGAGASAFCAGAEQHPELVIGAPQIALTYDARSFTPDAGSPAAFQPRLAVFSVPPELP